MTQYKMKYTILFFLMLSTWAMVNAQERIMPPGVKGIWFPVSKHDSSFQWNAQWIWVDNENKRDMMLARRSFDLSELPQKAVLRITASSQYHLYVNGQYVNRGPARSAPHHQSYDILDITGLVCEGKNLIAVRVHHQSGKHSYHYDGRAGLLAQLEFISQEMDNIITNSLFYILNFTILQQYFVFFLMWCNYCVGNIFQPNGLYSVGINNLQTFHFLAYIRSKF